MMSANAALKEQAYTVDAGDPVTTAGIAIIRTHKMGELAKAFGRPEIARRKVAEKLKSLGHQYDIDAMCLEALEHYVEEHGNVPNAAKVIASAQILDRLPDPQFNSGHRVVFAINEDGTDFIGASEMGLAIAPGGSTTTSRKGKVDERFGAITKKTLWIMIDFPEKTELDAIEMEQEKAFAAVAEAIADPATAAQNFDEIIAQVQELGEVTDMSPADVAATIQTIANVVQAHAINAEAHKIVEAGVVTSDSPQITGMASTVESITQQVAEQLAAPDAIVPPAIADMAQAVMETVQPPQAQATVEAAVATQTVEQSGTTMPTADAVAAADAPQVAMVEAPTMAQPQTFESTPPPAALAAQVVAIAAQIPPAQNTTLTQTVMKQVATAIKNEQPVTAPLQQKVEAVIATMPDGPAKQDLARVVETVKATQEARRNESAPSAPAQPAPVVAKLAFAQPANPVAPSPVPQPKNDNTPTNKGPIPTTVIPTPTSPPINTGPVPVTPTNPQPAPIGGPGPVVPPDIQPATGPRPPADPKNPPIITNKEPDNTPPAPPEDVRRAVTGHDIGDGGGHGPEDVVRKADPDNKVVPIEFKDNPGGGDGPQNPPEIPVIKFQKPCGGDGPCGPCVAECPFNKSAANPKEAAAHRQKNTQAMENDMARYEVALRR